MAAGLNEGALLGGPGCSSLQAGAAALCSFRFLLHASALVESDREMIPRGLLACSTSSVREEEGLA